MAKGSGMIHPSMATMLSYLTCDVGVDHVLWSDMIKRVAESSFNSITVDGDTSTNDTFLAFASGADLDPRYLSILEEGLHLQLNTWLKLLQGMEKGLIAYLR